MDAHSGRSCNWGPRGGTLEVVGGRWVYSGSPGFCRVHLEVVGFIRVRVGLRVRVIGSSGSFGFVWVNLAAPRRRQVHSGSRGLTRAGLVVVGFIGVRAGSLRRAKGSSGSFRFAWVHSDVHSVQTGSLGLARARQGVVGFTSVSHGFTYAL